MKKLVTLQTVTDGFLVEPTYYVVNLPTSYGNNILDMQRFCEKAFRNAALGTFIGISCEKILKEIESDYNWGDFLNFHSKSELAQFGICELDDYTDPISKSMLTPHVIVILDHDENLTPSNLLCDLVMRENGKEPVRISDCMVHDFGQGTIEIPTNKSANIENLEHPIFCDFGNGVEHRVARNEAEKNATGAMFLLA